jgi:hypothetical protein
VKLERGDSAWTLNTSEARRLAKMMAGWASELAQLETQADIVGLMNRIDARGATKSAWTTRRGRSLRCGAGGSAVVAAAAFPLVT